jgi:anti-anti-sigma factor
MLEVSVQQDGDTSSIALTGELHGSEAGALEQRFLGLALERAGGNLILDMKGVRSIDPAGLDAIRSIWASAHEIGVELILVRASTEVRYALEESGLDRVLPVVYECPEQHAG